jgi:hypothetical protein
MVAECPPTATQLATRVADILTRIATARSILEHRPATEETCELASRALLGDDVIAEAGA